jgi:DNA-binding XRE family transcriptional regulator
MVCCAICKVIHALPCLRFERQILKPMPIPYPENPVSIGDHIRKKRMELKLLQKDVAKICGVTEDCITNWEKNRSVPQIQFFPNIISFLGYFPIDIDTNTFSGRLKFYRYKNGLSQKQLGKILNVDGATVCSWESDEFQPMRKTMTKLQTLLEGQSIVSIL